MAQDIKHHRENLDPTMQKIIEKSSNGWLDNDDVATLFKFSGLLPISTGRADSGEGLYLYNIEEKIEDADWECENHKITVPGELHICYTRAYSSFTNSSNVNSKLERRVYFCVEYGLSLVNFRFVERQVKVGSASQKDSVGPGYTAHNLVAVYDGEPWINDILHESTYNWLDYGDMMSLFALAGKLPLSRGLAAGIDHLGEGVYVFNTQEELHTVDWYGYVTTVPGEVPVSYRTSYAIPNDPNLNESMERRLYQCDEYAARFILHCRLIGGGGEVEGEEDYGDDEEDEEEDGEGEGEGQEEDGEGGGAGKEENNNGKRLAKMFHLGDD